MLDMISRLLVMSMKFPDLVRRYGILPWYNELPLAAEIALFGWFIVCGVVIVPLGIAVDKDAIAAAIRCCWAASGVCTDMAWAIPSPFPDMGIVATAFVTSCWVSWLFWLDMFVRDKGCCNKTGIVGVAPGLAVVKLLTAVAGVLGNDCAVIDSPVIFQTNKNIKRR